MFILSRTQHADVNILSIPLFFRFSGVAKNRPYSLYLKLLLVGSLLILGYDATASFNTPSATKYATFIQRRSEGMRGCGPHRAALAMGGKRAKIVFKNSRENSDCNFIAVCVQ